MSDDLKTLYWFHFKVPRFGEYSKIKLSHLALRRPLDSSPFIWAQYLIEVRD